jgi:GH24 family phage-related lysozyme (muramidase)
MKLIINESQCKILIEQLKSPNPQEIADTIWSSVSGVGTDEEKMYSALKLINNQNILNSVNSILVKNHNQNLQQIILEPYEFTDEEKKTIYNIFKTNGLLNLILNGKKQKTLPSQQKTLPSQQKTLLDPLSLQPSDNLIKFLKCEEGKVGSNCQPELKSYGPPRDVWTIGWGHTGENVKPNMKINQSRAEQLLQNDTQKASDCVKRIFTEWKKNNINRTITQSMFDALTSLTFNAGCGSIRGDSAQNDLIDYVRAGKFAEATIDTISELTLSPTLLVAVTLN